MVCIKTGNFKPQYLFHDQVKHVELIYFVTLLVSRINCEFVVNQVKLLKLVMPNYRLATQQLTV